MNGKDNPSQHGKAKPDDKPMDGPNPDHTPTVAQSQDNRPTGTPNPENRPKRSNGNDGQKPNRMNGNLLLPYGFHLRACLVMLFCGFLSVWPIHAHFLILKCVFMGSWFALCQRFSFLTLSNHVSNRGLV